MFLVGDVEPIIGVDRQILVTGVTRVLLGTCYFPAADKNREGKTVLLQNNAELLRDRIGLLAYLFFAIVLTVGWVGLLGYGLLKLL